MKVFVDANFADDFDKRKTISWMPKLQVTVRLFIMEMTMALMKMRSDLY